MQLGPTDRVREDVASALVGTQVRDQTEGGFGGGRVCRHCTVVAGLPIFDCMAVGSHGDLTAPVGSDGRGRVPVSSNIVPRIGLTAAIVSYDVIGWIPYLARGQPQDEQRQAKHCTVHRWADAGS